MPLYLPYYYVIVQHGIVTDVNKCPQSVFLYGNLLHISHYSLQSFSFIFNLYVAFVSKHVKNRM